MRDLQKILLVEINELPGVHLWLLSPWCKFSLALAFLPFLTYFVTLIFRQVRNNVKFLLSCVVFTSINHSDKKRQKGYIKVFSFRNTKFSPAPKCVSGKKVALFSRTFGTFDTRKKVTFFPSNSCSAYTKPFCLQQASVFCKFKVS